MQQQYFVGIIPEASLATQVTRLKQHMAEQYGSSHALKSPPHVTLIPPFRYDPDRETELINLISAFAAARKPFYLKIDGFGNFPPRVIFLRVQPSDALNSLQRSLRELFTQRTGIEAGRRIERPFHPHMTIAFRDLSRSAFYRAWREVRGRSFVVDFCVGALHLLRHDGACWQVAYTAPIGPHL